MIKIKFYEEYSHNFGKTIIEQKDMYEEIKGLINCPDIGVARKISTDYKKSVESNCSMHGWVVNPNVSTEFNLTINSMKNKVGLTVQMGNITRAFYDLLKFQSMYLNDKIDSCVLVVPTYDAAKIFGSNVANILRIKNEISLYKHIISIPCLIIGIDE